VSAETVPAAMAGQAGDASAQLARLADEYVDDLSRRHPDAATELGDHRFDDLLPDRSQAALDDERRWLDGFAARLTDVDLAALSREQRVDVAMAANDVARRLFEIEELREHAWNPLLANPGMAIYTLLARGFAPLPDRLRSLAGRLEAIPGSLAAARSSLERMPKVHLETAIVQFGGTIGLVTGEVDAALRTLSDGSWAGGPDAGSSDSTVSAGSAVDPAAVAAAVERVRPAALAALAEHRDWLQGRLDSDGDSGFADPRIGADLYARKLSLSLNAASDAAAILARAEADLERITEEITRVAASLSGTPREVLDRLGADAPDGATILRFAADAFAAQTAFVREHDLITLYDDPVEVIEMPEINRGIAVAYCDPPGLLETAPLPTFIAVSPTPEDWSAERVASFYREYNRLSGHAGVTAVVQRYGHWILPAVFILIGLYTLHETARLP
jgi:uncharacterized protein (DUF885 family)